MINSQLQLLDAASPCPTYAFDNTAVEDWERCPTYARNKQLLRRTALKAAIALDFGGAIHQALEVRYRKTGGQAVTAALEAEQHAVLGRAYSKFIVPDEDHRHLGRAKEVITLYNEHFKQEPFEIVAVEMPFVCELGVLENALVEGTAYGNEARNVRLLYQGRIDLVVRDHNGRLWVVDFKTMDEFGAKTFYKYPLSSQLRGYCWAVAQTNVLGLPVFGGLIRAIVVRKPLQKEPSPSRPSKPRTEFQQDYFIYSPESIKEWHTNTIEKARNWLQRVASNNYPMHESRCSDYGGCMYRDVCLARPDQRDTLLASGEFQDVTWSPLNER